MGFKKPPQEYVPMRRWPENFTTEEIKKEIGSFEKEYDAACTGERVHAGPLGYTFEGVVEMAMKTYHAIARYERATPYPNGEKYDWAVTKIGWAIWDKNYWGMHELKCRREYARKKELQQLGVEAEKINKIKEDIHQLGIEMEIPVEREPEPLSMPKMKTESELEWEEKNGIRIEDIPF